MTEITLALEELTLQQRLEKIPILIKEIELKILALQIMTESMKEEMKIIELITNNEVSKITGTDGKAVFSNENKRDIETMMRLSNNVGFVELKKELKNKIFDLKTNEIHFVYCVNVFSATKKLVDLESLKIEVK